MSTHNAAPSERQGSTTNGLARDPYRLHMDPATTAVCPTCGAVHESGHWAWKKVHPSGAEARTCPACQRIADREPAGEITLTGAFLKQNRDAVEHLVRMTEESAKADHPLNRIMAMEWRDDTLVIATTDIPLARRIGHAIYDAYRGTLRYRRPAAAYHIRVMWERR